MPSISLTQWQTIRTPRLTELDGQCAAALTATLADSDLRAYVLLLAAEFQGFCRDLYGECVDAVLLYTPKPLRDMYEGQCYAGLRVDQGNANYETLRQDFARFRVELTTALATLPSINLDRTHLDHLNKWRNYAAHSKKKPPVGAGAFDLPSVRLWLQSCDNIAVKLDEVLYNQLVTLTGAPPW